VSIQNYARVPQNNTWQIILFEVVNGWHSGTVFAIQRSGGCQKSEEIYLWVDFTSLIAIIPAPARNRTMLKYCPAVSP
jgi:hypothetical protein